MQLPEAELTPDTILPVQLCDAALGGARVQPEKRLQIAVLSDAIMTFRKCAGVERTRPRRLFAEVAAWFASDVPAGPFAFATICDSLGFDPGYIRGGLRRWHGGPSLPRNVSGTRHQVVVARLRRVA